MKDTLQELIGQGKKVILEQKVCTGFSVCSSIHISLYIGWKSDSLFHMQIDPSILGGLVIEFDKKVFDMSIKTRARQMERYLREPVNFDNL